MTLLEEILAKCPPELIASRNDVAITAAVNVGRTRQDAHTKFTSLGIKERFPDLGGLDGALAAEWVLQKLEEFATNARASSQLQAQLLGDSIAREMAHLAGGGMAVGSPAVARLLAVVVQMGGISQEEMDALVSVAAVDDPVYMGAVSDALNQHQGLMTLGGI